ncbi:MAG: hypothetical protein QNJ60_00895 [Xenococcaceae cyanobacterium MO_188.B19]|nr:hypothetical protein [Xenococcaceae cyanobacterium MO_188.B19]
MSTQRLTQLLHPNRKHLNELTLVLLVLIASVLMGSIPLIYGSGSLDSQKDNWIIPTEAELWHPLTKAIN